MAVLMQVNVELIEMLKLRRAEAAASIAPLHHCTFTTQST